MTLKTTLIAAAALMAASAAAAPAAQAGNVDFNIYVGAPHAVGFGYGGYRDDRRRHAEPLSYRDVRRVLARHGYRHVRDIDRRGPFYVAKAARRNGSVYRIRIQAFTGRVVDQDLVWTPRGRRYGYGYGRGR